MARKEQQQACAMKEKALTGQTVCSGAEKECPHRMFAAHAYIVAKFNGRAYDLNRLCLSRKQEISLLATLFNSVY